LVTGQALLLLLLLLLLGAAGQPQDRPELSRPMANQELAGQVADAAARSAAPISFKSNASFGKLLPSLGDAPSFVIGMAECVDGEITSAMAESTDGHKEGRGKSVRAEEKGRDAAPFVQLTWRTQVRLGQMRLKQGRQKRTGMTHRTDERSIERGGRMKPLRHALPERRPLTHEQVRDKRHHKLLSLLQRALPSPVLSSSLAGCLPLCFVAAARRRRR